MENELIESYGFKDELAFRTVRYIHASLEEKCSILTLSGSKGFGGI